MSDIVTRAIVYVFGGAGIYFGSYIIASIIYVLFGVFESVVNKKSLSFPDVDVTLIFYLTIIISIVIYWIDKNERKMFMLGSWSFLAVALAGVGIKFIARRIKKYPYSMERTTKLMIISVFISSVAMSMIYTYK